MGILYRKYTISVKIQGKRYEMVMFFEKRATFS